MRNASLAKSLVFMCFGCSVMCSSGIVFADYDVVLTGVNRFQGTVSYSNKSICISEGAVVEYEYLALDNCIVDVNGFVGINSFLDKIGRASCRERV